MSAHVATWPSTHLAPALRRVAGIARQRITTLTRELAAWRSSAAPTGQHAADALHVRELALSVQRSDPGFAADLYAAAARHEAMFDEPGSVGR